MSTEEVSSAATVQNNEAGSEGSQVEPLAQTDQAKAVVKKAAHPGAEARALLQQLSANFSVFRECKPLALRVDASIRERMPEVERKVLRTALRMHTASTRYLKALERSSVRFNLDGEEEGELSEEHRQHAASTLKERFAAQAKQQREKRAAEEADKRRSEKLQQLVTKFER